MRLTRKEKHYMESIRSLVRSPSSTKKLREAQATWAVEEFLRILRNAHDRKWPR